MTSENALSGLSPPAYAPCRDPREYITGRTGEIARCLCQIRDVGSSHFEFRNGKIIREWRIHDEIAIIAQILRARAEAA